MRLLIICAIIVLSQAAPLDPWRRRDRDQTQGVGGPLLTASSEVEFDQEWDREYRPNTPRYRRRRDEPERETRLTQWNREHEAEVQERQREAQIRAQEEERKGRVHQNHVDVERRMEARRHDRERRVRNKHHKEEMHERERQHKAQLRREHHTRRHPIIMQDSDSVERF
ncbi:hypothetical protein WR25_25747 [Diploscapter pachys]|uniref:R domain-containing protein n=1 Tax=Diploscapter pachys TaxID=2018661 RepID=A0A2A2JDY5_9BILA|nr:hypothetical protein WR25_25747 [Diploscapter pachys]